jgi:hypothetical protein
MKAQSHVSEHISCKLESSASIPRYQLCSHLLLMGNEMKLQKNDSHCEPAQTLRHSTVDIQTDFINAILRILFNHALSLVSELLDCVVIPPLHHIAVSMEFKSSVTSKYKIWNLCYRL